MASAIRRIKALISVLTCSGPRRLRGAALRQQGQRVYRWGYTVRKCWTTLWGALAGVRVPRLRSPDAEVGLLEKYQRHALGEVLFALTVGG